jgi:capsid protein
VDRVGLCGAALFDDRWLCQVEEAVDDPKDAAESKVEIEGGVMALSPWCRR